MYSIITSCIYIYRSHIQVSQVPTIRCPKTPPPALRSPADPSRAAAFSRATSGKNVADGGPGCHGDFMGDITNVYDG